MMPSWKMFECYGHQFGILFIPFDAKKQFMALNAKHGVIGTASDGNVNIITEKPGTGMPNDDIINGVTSIIERLVLKVLVDTSYNRQYVPNLIFLSEEPKATSEESFPIKITIRIPRRDPIYGDKRIYKDIEFVRIGQTENKRREQKIFAYRNSTYLAEDRINAEEMVWIDPNYGKKQHILKVTYTSSPELDGNISYTVAGVHLTAKNTGIKAEQRQKIHTFLQDKCKEDGVQFLIGDFNFDVSKDTFVETDAAKRLKTSSGGTGLLGTEVGGYVIRQVMCDKWALSTVETFSNSTNSGKYMGMLKLSENFEIGGFAGGERKGRSLPRSFDDGRYYSDHSPIYVCLHTKRAREMYEGDDDTDCKCSECSVCELQMPMQLT